MTDTTQDLTKEFETETCSRCGGGGHYSYCQMYGTRCFRCGGAGKTYSKRGDAAKAFARSLRTVKASEIKVGWLLWEDASPFGDKAGWRKVVEIKASASCSISRDAEGNEVRSYYTEFLTTGMGHCLYADSEVQAVPNADRLKEIKTLALEYQATLTKQGKPAKRKAA